MEKRKIDQIETDRLLLRPLELKDWEDLSIPMRDQETMRYWNEPPHESIETTQNFIEKILTRPDHYGWAICLPEQNQVIGFLGFLRQLRVQNFIYLLRSDYWRQGYMTEAANYVLWYGFHELELDRIEAWVQEGNQASQALLSKLGFAFLGRLIQQYQHLSEPVEMLIHGLRAQKYLQNGIRQSKPVEFQSLEPVLAVNNVQESVDFYCHQLGFHVDFVWGDPPIHGAVSYGEWSTQSIRIQFKGAQPNSVQESSGEIFIMVEPEVETLYHRCQSQGLNITRELTSQPWGMQEFSIRDCNGYIIRFGKAVKPGLI